MTERSAILVIDVSSPDYQDCAPSFRHFIFALTPSLQESPRGHHFHYRDMTTTINSAPEVSAYRSSKVSVPVLGVGDKIGEGETYLVENVLPPELAEVAFENLMKEVAWNVMHHRGPLSPHPVLTTRDTDT